MPGITIGINLWSQATSWTDFLAAARRVDRLGYESLWTWDHLYAIFGDPYQPIFEGWGTVNAWAMATERVRLGLMVGANTFRNPGLVAKQAVTLDHVSGGRAVLGIGGAWMEEEHTAFGIPFGSGFGERLDRLDESVGAIRALLDGATVTSPTGGFYGFRELRLAPLPVQAHLPILIGGTGRKKTLRTVARYADRWNGFGLPAEMADLDGVLRGHCADVGRGEGEIERSVNLWLAIRDREEDARAAWGEWMARNRTPVEDSLEDSRPLLGPPSAIAARFREYVAAGCSSFIVEMPAPFDAETLERLVGEVVPLVEAAG